LAEFFAQHIARWEKTDHPSQFRDPKQESFYRAMVAAIDPLGATRFTEVRVAGRLVASHLGFFHAGRFTWYKPTYDPELAKISPGETLLKRLIDQAMREGASEFDFTIGDEAFKTRFATRTRTIADIYVTRSRWASWSRQAYRGLRRQVGKWVRRIRRR
jgi:CelD/BcsL family acetyltransferase involved in cellulose biosynthesis